MPPARAGLAEFIGTFALMFVGGAAIILTGGENLLIIALAHGLILGVMVSATMHISGGQFNPAVSIALATFGKQSWGQAGTFIVAQCLGSLAAAFLLTQLMVGQDVDAVKVGATVGSATTGGHVAAVVGLEIIATFFLMFVILGTAVDDRGIGGTATIGGLAIGLVVAADILAIGPLTGASMNPARTLGPAIIASEWTMHWAYWLAPIVGALLAGAAYLTFSDSSGEETE